MRHIHLFPVNRAAHLVHPDEFHELSAKSPALDFLTDFKKHVPFTVASAMAANVVRVLMVKAHVNLTLVVDAEGEFIGTISLDELDEQHFMAQVAHGFSHKELSVFDMMTPKHKLMALGLAELEEATIEDVIKTLQQNGEQHCLVVDQSNTQIRGLLSAADIARRLQIPIRIERVPSFADIFSSIRRPAA